MRDPVPGRRPDAGALHRVGHGRKFGAESYANLVREAAARLTRGLETTAR